MRFSELLSIVGDEPLFETALLLAGDVDPNDARRQLSRWTAAGKVHQLRRGLYALAPPYRKARPHPFLVANRLVKASYVSLQSALAHHGLIPEYVPVVTSVTATRPVGLDTPLGRFLFRHVKQSLFYGFDVVEVGEDQSAFVAAPEKALLDQIYLHPGGDDPAYLRGLRLQNLERLRVATLRQMMDRAAIPKLTRAVDAIEVLAREERALYETLPGGPS